MAPTAPPPPAAHFTAADWAAAWQAESTARAADFAALLGAERAALLFALALAVLAVAALLILAGLWAWADLRRRIDAAALDPGKLLPYLADNAEHLSRLGRAMAPAERAPARPLADIKEARR